MVMLFTVVYVWELGWGLGELLVIVDSLTNDV